MTSLTVVKSKAVTNGTRHQVNLKKSKLVQKPCLIKNTTVGKHSSYGRSKNTGHITSWHRQRGRKRSYRVLKNNSILSIVLGICYDPNRNGLIALNFDIQTKRFYYTLCSNKCLPGMVTQYSSEGFIKKKIGYRAKINTMSPGTILYNVGPDRGIYARAAGTHVQLINVIKKEAKILLPSGEEKTVSSNFFGTLGKVSNQSFFLRCLGKAGKNRSKGRRPIVRGVAMNPVDHPHGGRTNGGRPSVTPWGFPTKLKFKVKRRKSRGKL